MLNGGNKYKFKYKYKLIFLLDKLKDILSIYKASGSDIQEAYLCNCLFILDGQKGQNMPKYTIK